VTKGIDLVDGRLPLPLGGGAVLGLAASDVDVTIEGVPFWLAIDQNFPYQRQTAPFKKDQVDQQPEAGEQSLQSWWIRSQMSFHMGAGLRYLDTNLRPDDVDRVRFADGRGIDPWTPGIVKRLNGTTLAQAAAGSGRIFLETTVVGGVEKIIAADGTTVKAYDGTTWTTLYTGTFTAFCTDGANWYAASTSGVWKGSLAGGAATQIYAVTGSGTVVLGWVKARLMLAVGQSIYQLDCNAAANTALPTALLLHPTAGWAWTGFCETPNGIGYVGYAGLTSQVYKSELTSTGGAAPVLGAGVVLLTLPPGEIANAAMLYLGSMLILGTNRGIRVSTFQSYFGTVTLGPLVQLQGDGVSMNITALSAYDRFVFGGTVVDGKPALMRVDLGTPIDQPGHYPWAYDLLPPVGASISASATVSAITVHANGLKLFAVPTYGIVAESATPDPAQPAWFTTARIRVGSVEDKHWSHGIVRGSVDPGDLITVEAQTPVDGWVTEFAASSNGDRFDLKLTKGEWIQLRFTLGNSAQLASYVVQSLPAGQRQRMLSIPLWLMDYQVTRSGQSVGYDGWALSRLEELEAIEADGAEITLTAPALFPYSVRGVIEQLTFQQTDDPGDRATGTGGRLVVALRTTS
jgi:hypothetical protein